MKKHTRLLSFLIFNCIAIGAFAQISLSGIINNYTAVQALDTCTFTITVADTAGFRPGGQILIMQMQGATINGGNSSSFGAILSYNSAGLYEKCTIATRTANTLTVRNRLLHTYNPATGVQLVTFPTFMHATLTDTVKAKKWDGATGGVVAFEVSGTLTMNAPINASESGFRGGRSISLPNGCTGGFNNADNYYYESDNWRGAEKGEGIAKPIPGKENGRGAQANGGGGGNDHNSGGGGGANIRDGGNGGERVSPFLSGDCRGGNPGKGGRGLQRFDNRLYLGGGGGAGHSNNNVGSDGGAGGGIVILRAGTITGSEKILLANGESANNTNGGDGAGGGGAAGSIMVEAQAIDGQLQVIATGGDGGNADNRNDDNCFGPGGGGSGGLLRTLNANATASLTGGKAGRTINSSRSCNNSTNGAQDGVSGTRENLFLLPESSIPALSDLNHSNPPAIFQRCAGDTISIFINVETNGFQFQWQINEANGFEDLTDDNFFSGLQSNQLNSDNLPAQYNGRQFRLAIADHCGNEIFTTATTIQIAQAPIAAFNFSTANNTVTFTNNSIDGRDYFWDFGDGNTSPQSNPIHTYTTDGIYTVTLIVENDCGGDTLRQTVSLSSLPAAGFTADSQDGCAPFTVSFNNASSTNVQSYQWFFEGGNPLNSALENPVVTYASSGTFDVILIVTNALGADTLLREDYISVHEKPVAQFTANITGLNLTLSNQSTGIDALIWDFGDGTQSTLANPSHTYSMSGTFDIRLIAQNNCGRDTSIQTIQTGFPPIANFDNNRSRGCAPLTVQFENRSVGTLDSIQWEFPGGTPDFATDSLVEVRYNTPGIFDVRLIAYNALGTDTLTLTDYIQVFKMPTAGFNFQINNDTVYFQNTSIDANTFIWDFGYGTPLSNEVNPVHVFPANGIYFVTLNAMNNNCSSSITFPVGIEITSTATPVGLNPPALYPNPVRSALYLDMRQQFKKTDFEIKVFGTDGRQYDITPQLSHGLILLNCNWLPDGRYWLQLSHKNNIYIFNFLKL